MAGKIASRLRRASTTGYDEHLPKNRSRRIASGLKRWLGADMYTAALPIDSLTLLCVKRMVQALTQKEHVER